MHVKLQAPFRRHSIFNDLVVLAVLAAITKEGIGDNASAHRTRRHIGHMYMVIKHLENNVIEQFIITMTVMHTHYSIKSTPPYYIDHQKFLLGGGANLRTGRKRGGGGELNVRCYVLFMLGGLGANCPPAPQPCT